MDLLLPLISSMFLLLVVGEGQGGVGAPQAYWDTVLPNTRMPSAIQQLLRHEDDAYVEEKVPTSVNVGKGGVNVHTGKGTAVNVGHGGVGVNTGKPGTTVNVGHGGVGVRTGRKGSPGGGTTVNVGKGGVGVSTGPTHKSGSTSVNVGRGGVGVTTKPKGKPVVVHVNPKNSPFDYLYAADDTQLHDDPSVALFFLQKDLHRGKEMTLQLAEAGGGSNSAAFIPRSAAESIPFSTAELPSTLSRFGIDAGSDEAAAMKGTLSKCEAAPAKGETKKCATSLEEMVDFATERLGTREVEAASTEGGGEGERRRYRVEAAKKVAAAGGKGVVVCHPEEYAYAVFFCHATRAAEVYEVRMAAEDGRGAEAVAVCHTDTAGWNPKHLAFRVLGVKPGTVPVCHFLPRDHVVWASKA